MSPFDTQAKKKKKKGKEIPGLRHSSQNTYSTAKGSP